MSTDRDNKADERISALYRKGTTATAPEALNRAVLAEATRAVKSPASDRRNWFRPLAFAATVVLGVALLFDMRNELQAPAIYPITENEVAGLDADSATEPAESPAATIESDAYSLPVPATATPAMRRQEKFGASRDLGEPRDDTVFEPRNQINAIAEEARQPLQDLADTATRRESVSAARRSAAPASAMESKSRQAPRCQLTDSADDWWQCVVKLRDAGDTDAATAELARLREQHPEFTVPE